MSDLDFSFEGGKELQRQLNRLDAKIEKKLIGQSIRAAAVHLRRRLIQRVPRAAEEQGEVPDDVHLHSSIGIVTKRRKNPIVSFVGYTGLARQYGHVIEFGSQFVTGTRTWTKTMRGESKVMLDKMADKLRKGLAKL